MGGEDGINQSGLSQAGLAYKIRAKLRRGLCVEEGSWTRTDDDHVELETTFQELVLYLTSDGVKTDVGVGSNFFDGWGRHGV